MEHELRSDGEKDGYIFDNSPLSVGHKPPKCNISGSNQRRRTRASPPVFQRNSAHDADEHNADEHNADEHNADEHNADEHNADEHDADGRRGIVGHDSDFEDAPRNEV